jgi:hypothetical protein
MSEPFNEELILVSCEGMPDWWIIERARHDGRECEEYSEDGTSAFTSSSARIVNGDIEGPGYEMHAVAQAIEQGKSARFKRCQVTWTKSGYLMGSPRGGSVLVAFGVALHLAADIRHKIGYGESPSEKVP